MKIIITGATGSLGAHLVRHYAAAGHEILAVGRTANPPVTLLKLAKWQQADITKTLSFPEADVIVHCAGLADDRANRQDLFAANVLGTENVCLAAKHIPLFIHISSSSVYSFSQDPISEDYISHSSEKNLSPYGWSKLLAEKTILEKSHSTKNVILRPRGIYGPGDKVLLPRLLGMVKNERFISPGKMNVLLSMTHFENLAHAIDCVLRSALQGNREYNIADAQPYVLFDVLKQLLDAIHKNNLPIKHLPLWALRPLALLRVGGLSPLFLNTITKNVTLDITRARTELNYQPIREFDSSVSELAAWVEKMGGPDIVRSGSAELAWR